MANRPDFIDVRSKSSASVGRPLRSPRLHIAGEAPPELSPLDAFALQSRLLAKQLQESAKSGRRMSRLPPLTTESPLILQGRSEYFRSLSHDSASEDDFTAQHSAGSGFRPEVETDINNRPVSVHPRMSRIPPTPEQNVPVPTLPPNLDSQKETEPEQDRDNYFGVGARREHSPGPMDATAAPAKLTRTVTQESIPLPASTPTRSITSSPERISKTTSHEAGGLVPPRPLFTKRSSSLMSSHDSSADDEGFSTPMSTSFHSQGSRKFSTSSGVLSPGFAPYQRSPSISSDISALPRPSFNFSRPLSRAGTPTLDPPARQASSDSHTSFMLTTDDAAHTPVSMSSEALPESTPKEDVFVLPRGKALQRNSVILPDMKTPARFSWEQPVGSPPNSFENHGQPPPSPPSRPSSSAGLQSPPEINSRPSHERSKLSTEIFRSGPEPFPPLGRPSTESARVSGESQRGRAPVSHLHDAAAGRSIMSNDTSDSASTIKAGRPIQANPPTMADLTAEEHVNKAIALHQDGSLPESAWHLRHAAKQGHPTGMLLYALACRHGWGMRPNPREGVEWLRKAMDSANLEIKEDEEHAKEGKHVDVTERKTHRAQLALSIYELGVSHMNGWGIEQDKVLALKCFETAGAWGDVDALAEAGFCYAQGIGCKKNLKKSAKLYREAESKGMSMVGNSWIHKPKYADDPEKDKKARSKSKSRKSIFSRKTQ
ncbi:hypothetical protein B0T21DRAFT_277064 [Apiosordaria backusii]|uniref:Uncharacterized protein n=1 Tax=Apiosordaria backusii TaxID=314023 RepID=A0AA40K6S7_9PEZI|nr:hypothetical protein B0T21DRAFT_277064 [Apiosordaria backusii]